MIKKILFYGIAIILGLMLWMTTYYGFYMSHIQNLIQGSIESKDYDSLSKAFLPFYNKEEYEFAGSDKFAPIHVYEAMVGEKIEVTVENEKRETNRYERAFVIYLDDITFDLEGVETADSYVNNTKVRLYNDDKYFDYYFNEPNNIKDPNDKEVKRYYVTAAKQLGFVELDITEKIVVENLNGAIDAVEIYDAKNQLVGNKIEFGKDLTFDTEFFKLGSEIENAYDIFLNDPTSEESGKKYQEFYLQWFDKYKANENFGVAYTKSELKPMSVYLKTGGVLVAYVVLVCVVGYFLLRSGKSSTKTFIPKERKVIEPKNVDENPRICENINNNMSDSESSLNETAMINDNSVDEIVEESTETEEKNVDNSTENLKGE